MALRELLPRLRAAETQLGQSRPQQGGREPTKPIYSADAREAALAVSLALSELKAWAAATATKQRNGRIVGAISPKRHGDAGEKQTPPATGAGSASSSAPPNGSSANSATDPAKAFAQA